MLRKEVVDSETRPKLHDAPSYRVARSGQLLLEGSRLQVTAGGRFLALFRYQGKLYAIDATCYHAGGPLLPSDIEDCGEFGPAVRCPWHEYQISLTTGEKLYCDLNNQIHTTAKKKQRVHLVWEKDGAVHVSLDTSEEKIESDHYAYKPPAPSHGTGRYNFEDCLTCTLCVSL
jgi:nitrite reductase/ring-hydroxylating ferredoxin subunit